MVIGSGITPNVKYRIKESKPVNQETHQRMDDNGFQHSCKRLSKRAQSPKHVVTHLSQNINVLNSRMGFSTHISCNNCSRPPGRLFLENKLKCLRN